MAEAFYLPRAQRDDRLDARGVLPFRQSQLSFSKASELVRDGAPSPGCHPIIHRLSAEALADRIDGPVGARPRDALCRTGTAAFVAKPERQLQLHDRMRFEM